MTKIVTMPIQYNCFKITTMTCKTHVIHIHCCLMIYIFLECIWHFSASRNEKANFVLVIHWYERVIQILISCDWQLIQSSRDKTPQVLNQSETVELGKIVGHCQRIHLNIRTRFSKSISQIFKEFFSATSGFFRVKFLNHKSFIMTKKTTALLINKDI